MSDWSSDVCSSDLWREEKEPGVASFEDLIGLFAVIAGQVVEDHDVARIQRRRELGFDVDSKDLFGHRPVDDPGRDRKSVVSGKSVSVRVDCGGRRTIKKKQTKKN